MKESKAQMIKFLKNKRFELAHLVIDTREILSEQLGDNDLIEEYYHSMLSAISNLLKLENQLKGDK